MATTYEAGIKGGFLDGTGWLSAAIFYTQFDDMQVSIFNGSGFSVSNAAEATSKGMEIDASTYQDGYTMVNARVALGTTASRWQVSLRGTNLGDETVMTGTVDLPFTRGAYGARILPPRSYFLDIRASL